MLCGAEPERIYGVYEYVLQKAAEHFGHAWFRRHKTATGGRVSRLKTDPALMSHSVTKKRMQDRPG